MAYKSLEDALLDLERHGHLVRVKEEVDPYLEMAAIHLRVHEAGGPALLFEKVKGSRYQAASNLFGTLERSRFLFRDTLPLVERLIELRQSPMKALRRPFSWLRSSWGAIHALPMRNPLHCPVTHSTIPLSDLPQIHHWPMDGGAFVTLPQVYTEDPEQPGILHANLGMYRIQLSGNEYEPDQEIGLHYQLHRGIGVHQTKAREKGMPLKVSIFVGGPPAHTLASVMPLPEGMSEMTFAGLLAGRRFRYKYQDGYCLSTDADFVITGEVVTDLLKPEGPFGDHLGYYSLKHPFPVLKVHRTYARPNAIWPFTVVGRPPQEDTAFGDLIHSITGNAIQQEIPGLREVHAVDAAGVHPLLLAIGSERYTPYLDQQQPAEILTIANHILGTGQLSLAKYLFITADPRKQLSTHDVPRFFQHILERIDFRRDVHFHTQTSIDTLDYSGESLNRGSKGVFAAYGEPLRRLAAEPPAGISWPAPVREVRMVMPGICAVSLPEYRNTNQAAQDIQILSDWAANHLSPPASNTQGCLPETLAMLVVVDDATFCAASLRNFLWLTFTRSNPSHDIHGSRQEVRFKHWGCEAPLIIDARKKPHHAPAMEPDPKTIRQIEKLFQPGGSLHGIGC